MQQQILNTIIIIKMAHYSNVTIVKYIKSIIKNYKMKLINLTMR